jgi:hypothetical protein
MVVESLTPAGVEQTPRDTTMNALLGPEEQND